MDIKALLTSPYVLAAAGGAASYYFKGRHEKGKGKYLWPAGGVVAGYVAGVALQKLLAPPPAALPAQQSQAPLPEGDAGIDLDFDDEPQLVAAAQAAEVAAIAPEELGSLGGDSVGGGILSDSEIDELVN